MFADGGDGGGNAGFRDRDIGGADGETGAVFLPDILEAQKFGGVHRLRVLKHLARCALLDDMAIGQDGEPVGEAREGGVVRGGERWDAAGVDGVDQPGEGGVAGGGVERGGGFVQEQKFCAAREGAGERNALRLAA